MHTDETEGKRETNPNLKALVTLDGDQGVTCLRHFEQEFPKRDLFTTEGFLLEIGLEGATPEVDCPHCVQERRLSV